ncbi:DUF1249 domain-containing protein [Alkalilimnicola sp. S0819]|uniref:DUF1249 domain-containing protein n=1 Tax=Alkalilimnicola sp. S0819 TaxID=2613922 RepID=UPI0039AFEE6F
MLLTPHTPLAELTPGSFASLMELYESNYIYMRRLVPELRQLGPREVSRGGSADLHLEVLEKNPYTTTCHLTHLFGRDGEGVHSLPNLKVRVYHDARSAEVLPERGLEAFARHRCEPRPVPGSLAWKWELNRFLNRWLRYCLGQGHGFSARSEPGVA